MHGQTEPLHRSILTLLDLCVSTSDAWTTLNSPDVPPARRARPRYRGLDSADSSDEDRSEREEQSRAGASFVSFADEPFAGRVGRMRDDVRGLVEQIRAGVGRLGRTAEGADAREMYTLLGHRLA